jgi:hypothetical protein
MTSTDATSPELEPALETITDLSPVMFVNEDWMPELVFGLRQSALQASLRTQGQKLPILLDTNNVCWDGRSRFLIAKEDGRSILALRVDPKTARDMVFRSLSQRHLTVLDMVRLVTWIRTEHFPDRAQVCPGDKRDQIVRFLGNLEWHHDINARMIGQYLRLSEVLEDTDEDRRWILRNAKSLKQALRRIFPKNPRLKKTPGEQALALIKRLQKKLLEAAEDPDYGDATAALHAMVQVLPTQRVA